MILLYQIFAGRASNKEIKIKISAGSFIGFLKKKDIYLISR